MNEGIKEGGKNGEISRQVQSGLEGIPPVVIRLMDSRNIEKPRTRERIIDDLSAMIGFFSGEVERLHTVLEQEGNKEQTMAVLAQLESDTQRLRDLWKEFSKLKPPREL